MKCQNCETEAPEAALECPGCGLVFSKWRDPAAKAQALAKAKIAAVSSLTKWWVIVGCIAVFDDFFMSQGIISMFCAVPTLLALLPGTIFKAFCAPRPTAVRAAATGFGVLLVLSLLAFVPLNNILAKKRAHELIAACNKYKASHGDFPDRLQDLVPEFIPEVPRAKYTPRYGEFSYHRGNLMWTSIPPFGRPYYDFYSERWGFLD